MIFQYLIDTNKRNRTPFNKTRIWIPDVREKNMIDDAYIEYVSDCILKASEQGRFSEACNEAYLIFQGQHPKQEQGTLHQKKLKQNKPSS